MNVLLNRCVLKCSWDRCSGENTDSLPPRRRRSTSSVTVWRLPASDQRIVLWRLESCRIRLVRFRHGNDELSLNVYTLVSGKWAISHWSQNGTNISQDGDTFEVWWVLPITLAAMLHDELAVWVCLCFLAITFNQITLKVCRSKFAVRGGRKFIVGKHFWLCMQAKGEAKANLNL